MALSSPDSTSPALIGLPAFRGAFSGFASSCPCSGSWAQPAEAGKLASKMDAKAKPMANRRFVIRQSRPYLWLERRALAQRGSWRLIDERPKSSGGRDAIHEA